MFLLLITFIFLFFFFLMTRPPPISTLFPSTPLFQSRFEVESVQTFFGELFCRPTAGDARADDDGVVSIGSHVDLPYAFFSAGNGAQPCCAPGIDRKSTRLNSSHGYISYAVFCLKKKN